MWLTRRLSKIRQLSWTERGLLLEAAVWLALSRLALLLVPFQRIAPRLGTLHHESASTALPTAEQTAEKVGWAVQAIARRTPWESACLAQAMSAKAMLRRRHLPSTLYLGLAKDASQSLQAHAWLRCGAMILTGEVGHERFTVISSFAEEAPHNVPELTGADSLEASEVQLTLLAALNPVPQAATADQLSQLNDAEWAALVQYAQQQHVVTLLLGQLQMLQVETAVPPHLFTQMQQKYQQVTLKNLAIYRELRLIADKMQAANIPLILLKGPYLATAVYDHIGQRTIGDLDLLVPVDSVQKTIALLHTLGWQKTRNAAVEVVQQHIYHLPALVKRGVNFPLELHWNVAHPHKATSISPEVLWQKRVTTHLAGVEITVFPAHVQLLHLALHAAYNHQFAFDLRSLCDIAWLIHQKNSELDWDALVEKAIEWKWRRGVFLTLKLVQEFWPETAVPPQVLSQLQPAQMPENLTALAKQQLLWGRSNNKELSPNFAQLKNNKSLPEKALFILSAIIPPRSRLSWRYGVPLASPKIWLYYPIHLKKIVGRNARRTWHLLRGNARVTNAASRRVQLAEWLARAE
ncbi:MAG: lasso peptide biosynthesis B2 protein [Ardenticatenaceae bacterium]|nr:lasso peptide biosynthesis B2 protein [Ardenticatenaceae bacterium]